MTPFFLLVLAAQRSSGPSGLALLQEADAWVDADQSTLTTVDVLHNFNPRSTSFLVGATLSDIVGPEGELGTKITEGGTTVAAQVRYPVTGTDLSLGHVTWRYRFRPYDDIGSGRWRGFSDNSGGAWTQVHTAALMRDTFTAVIDRWALARNSHMFTLEENFAGWFDFEHETHINAINTTIFPSFYQSGSQAGNSSPVFDIAYLQAEQKRLSAATDVRDATSRYSEATNIARQCVIPTGWCDGGACFAEAWSQNGSNTTPYTVAASTPVTCHFVGHLWWHQPPPLNSQILRVGDISVQANIDGNLHLVQGVTDVDTGNPNPVVPVCYSLRVSGGTATLFIDGVEVGSASMTQGSTGYAIGGGAAGVSWKNESRFSTVQTDAEIEAVALELRSQAGLPASFPLIINTGQSNASENQDSRNLLGSGLRVTPGWAHRKWPLDTGPIAWRNAPPLNPYDSATTSSFGTSNGVHEAAIAAHAPHVLLTIAQIGAVSSLWVPGGDAYDGILAAVADSVALLGTARCHVDGVIMNQGEGDTGDGSDGANYLDNWRAFRAGMRSEFGAGMKFAFTRINDDFNSGTPEGLAAVRAGAAQLAAEDPLSVMVDIDAVPLLDGIHYTADQYRELGAIQYAAYASI